MLLITLMGYPCRGLIWVHKRRFLHFEMFRLYISSDIAGKDISYIPVSDAFLCYVFSDRIFDLVAISGKRKRVLNLAKLEYFNWVTERSIAGSKCVTTLHHLQTADFINISDIKKVFSWILLDITNVNSFFYFLASWVGWNYQNHHLCQPRWTPRATWVSFGILNGMPHFVSFSLVHPHILPHAK